VPRGSVVFFISSHGFGHASREIELVNALGPLIPDHEIVIRTSVARWLFDRTVRVPFTFIHGDCDTGIVQIDSLHLDEAETIARAEAFYRDLPHHVDREAALLRSHDARLVIADAPPLACAAAAAAGIPSIVVSNFTWDWIYEGYPGPLASASDLVPTIKAAYRNAREAWRLPMHGGFEPFDRVTDLPYIARHAEHGRDHVRAALGLPHDRPLALSSFGGYGVRDLDPARLDCLDAFGVVITGHSAPESLPHGVHFVDERRIYDAGLHYEDLVAAADVVVTKPGYGIIAECIANTTAMLYTSRGRFREYDVMVAGMPRALRCEFIDNGALLAGRWLEPLTRLLRQPAPPETPATDGAQVAARMIVERIGHE
jgi:L-arabinokinase